MKLNTDAINKKTVIEGIDFSNFYDKWGFVSIACSKLTKYCEVHRGLFYNDYDTFKGQVDNGVLENRHYHNDLLFWKKMSSCFINITGPVEGNKYHFYMKEF